MFPLTELTKCLPIVADICTIIVFCFVCGNLLDRIALAEGRSTRVTQLCFLSVRPFGTELGREEGHVTSRVLDIVPVPQFCRCGDCTGAPDARAPPE